jgi:hypothetical protein
VAIIAYFMILNERILCASRLFKPECGVAFGISAYAAIKGNRIRNFGRLAPPGIGHGLDIIEP